VTLTTLECSVALLGFGVKSLADLSFGGFGNVDRAIASVSICSGSLIYLLVSLTIQEVSSYPIPLEIYFLTDMWSVDTENVARMLSYPGIQCGIAG
jgi:hypothetical protein